MKEIKKLMITLVALLALTTGAWADGIVCTASDLGKVLCTDGSIYENVSAATTAGKEAVAMIAYVDETNKNGLALALTDEDGMTWDNSSPSNKGKTAPEICSALNTSKAVTGGTWKLPSKGEWQQMFSANGGNEESYTGLKTAIGNAGGTALVEGDDYWSSSEVDDWDAWLVNLADGNASWDTYGKHYSRCIRACLAFDIAAASGPKVTWDKTSKTGSFTMPGGNVELEPEYYPQAALTAQPTAINDVPATTDGAIVKAGTVKNIGETTTAQGTLMYYVSPTALDDAALLALAADQWKADVPTAKSLAQGQAYVYYYVRGNDSDTDEENFSDGDILAANALTVTIAAAPTYAVTFADDLAEPTLWTASPNAGVTKGQTVTVTYTGTKKVLGVKAEKKAAVPPAEGHALSTSVVGELIGSDGKAYAAADKENLPKGVTAVAMVAYKSGSNGLAIALTDETGTMNWTTASSTCEGKTAVGGNSWHLPSLPEWKQMFAANGGDEASFTGLNTAITTAGGTGLTNWWDYWTSSLESGLYVYITLQGEAYDGKDDDTWELHVRACLAF